MKPSMSQKLQPAQSIALKHCCHKFLQMCWTRCREREQVGTRHILTLLESSRKYHSRSVTVTDLHAVPDSSCDDRC